MHAIFSKFYRSLLLAMLLLLLGACAQEQASNFRVEKAEVVKAIVDSGEIPLPNCGGTNDLPVSFSTRASVGKTVSVGSKAVAGAGAEVEIPTAVKLTLEGQVESTYQQAYDVENSQLYEIQMTAKPGTHVVYVIEWEEQTYTGAVSYLLGGQTHTAPYQYVLRVPRLRDSYQKPCPGSAASTPTPDLPTAPVAQTLNPDASLSLHYWTSRNGGNNFLKVPPYPVGVSHIEDLPVAGESIVVLTFEVSPLRGQTIRGARLDLSAFDIIGNPFSAFGDLVIEEISFADFGFDVIGSTPQREIARLNSLIAEIDITNEIKEVIDRGSKRFQIRLRFAGVAIADEFTQRDEYVKWDAIGLIAETER